MINHSVENMPIKTLIILCHPDINSSTINKAIIETITTYAEVIDLYKLYPNFKINVEQEQQRLLNYDRIIFQHPIYWYGAPSLLKEWIDKVIVRAFAYGKGNYHLENKTLRTVVSTGATEETYCDSGKNLYTIADFLKPYEGLANFCKMNYEPPLVFYNAYQYQEPSLAHFIEQYKHILLNE